MKSFSSRRRFAAVLALSALSAPVAFAQTALPRTITLVVPQAPGGSNDVFARALAERLPKVIDSTVVVENRRGTGLRVAASGSS